MVRLQTDLRLMFVAVLVIIIVSCSPGNNNKQKDEIQASTPTNEALLKAIRTMDYNSVSSLITRADVTYRDEFGNDALLYSIVYPRAEIFQLVMTKKPNLNSVYDEHKNILHIAIESNLEKRGYFSFIESLINSNVEINLQDDHGNTPLSYACISYVVNPKTIKLLLEKGADMHLVNKYGRSAYSGAKEYDRKELLEILEKYNKRDGN